jgi:STE24 endopeptidase
MRKIIVMAFALTFVGALAMVCDANAAEGIAIPATSREALEYHHSSNWFWALSWVCGLALPALLVATGWGARLYSFGLRITRQRKSLSVALFAAIYFLFERLVRLPVRFLWDRAYERFSGVQSQATGYWISEQVSGWLLPGLALAALAVILYWLIAKSPRRWWLWTSAVASLLILTFLLAEPFTQTNKPLGDSLLGKRIVELAAQVNIQPDRIVVEHCDPASSCPPGRVIGMGPTRLMLLNDTLMSKNPEPWTLLTAAHEAKHFVKDDNIKALFLLSGLAVLGLWLVHFIGSWLVARTSRYIGFSDLKHPASLPLVILLFSAFYLIVLPPVNAFRQQVELDADRFALELLHDNVSQGEMVASWATDKRRVTELSTFYKLFRASHPSDGARIRLANAYGH